jgi:hypothetical protein
MSDTNTQARPLILWAVKNDNYSHEFLTLAPDPGRALALARPAIVEFFDARAAQLDNQYARHGQTTTGTLDRYGYVVRPVASGAVLMAPQSAHAPIPAQATVRHSVPHTGTVEVCATALEWAAVLASGGSRVVRGFQEVTRAAAGLPGSGGWASDTPTIWPGHE